MRQVFWIPLIIGLALLVLQFSGQHLAYNST